MAYVAQSAWILNSTVQDNILFGVPYDAKKYQTCLEAGAYTRPPAHLERFVWDRGRE